MNHKMNNLIKGTATNQNAEQYIKRTNDPEGILIDPKNS